MTAVYVVLLVAGTVLGLLGLGYGIKHEVKAYETGSDTKWTWRILTSVILGCVCLAIAVNAGINLYDQWSDSQFAKLEHRYNIVITMHGMNSILYLTQDGKECPAHLDTSNPFRLTIQQYETSDDCPALSEASAS